MDLSRSLTLKRFSISNHRALLYMYQVQLVYLFLLPEEPLLLLASVFVPFLEMNKEDDYEDLKELTERPLLDGADLRLRVAVLDTCGERQRDAEVVGRGLGRVTHRDEERVVARVVTTVVTAAGNSHECDEDQPHHHS